MKPGRERIDFSNSLSGVSRVYAGGGGGGELPSGTAGKTTYGGRGGSGIVIVRYLLPLSPKGTVVVFR
jgi:hypothetical protein